MKPDRYLAACVHSPWSTDRARWFRRLGIALLVISVLAFASGPALIFVGMGQTVHNLFLVVTGLSMTVVSMFIVACAGMTIQAAQPISESVVLEQLDSPLAGACLSTAVQSWRQAGLQLHFRDYWVVRDAIEYRRHTTGSARAASTTPRLPVAQGAT